MFTYLLPARVMRTDAIGTQSHPASRLSFCTNLARGSRPYHPTRMSFPSTAHLLEEFAEKEYHLDLPDGCPESTRAATSPGALKNRHSSRFDQHTWFRLHMTLHGLSLVIIPGFIVAGSWRCGGRQTSCLQRQSIQCPLTHQQLIHSC